MDGSTPKADHGNGECPVLSVEKANQPSGVIDEGRPRELGVASRKLMSCARPTDAPPAERSISMTHESRLLAQWGLVLAQL